MPIPARSVEKNQGIRKDRLGNPTPASSTAQPDSLHPLPAPSSVPAGSVGDRFRWSKAGGNHHCWPSDLRSLQCVSFCIAQCNCKACSPVRTTDCKQQEREAIRRHMQVVPRYNIHDQCQRLQGSRWKMLPSSTHLQLKAVAVFRHIFSSWSRNAPVRSHRRETSPDKVKTAVASLLAACPPRLPLATILLRHRLV